MAPWKCERCGKCCKHITLLNVTLNEDQRRYLNAHAGIRVSKDNHVIISSKCAYLSRVGRIYKCIFHGTPLKPDICKNAGEKECIRRNKDYR